MTAPAASGILIVNKPVGPTSFQVVAQVRRLLRAHKVGHGGTLDPQAAGVLPVLVNEATKLTPYLAEHTKEYVATVRLGVVTDTQDLTGKVLWEAPVPDLTSAVIQEILLRFVGQIQQLPPMYSALHKGGRRLYELARQGLEVQREPRSVTVHALALESIDLPRFTLRVVCGKGTYVRALCADIGEALGCGAALDGLVRTRVGPYGLEAAVPWDAIPETRDAATVWSQLLPVDSAVSHLPAVRLPDDAAAAFLKGRRVPAPEPVPADALARAYAASGAFLGLGRLFRVGNAVRPERIIHADHPGARLLPA